MYCQYVLHIFRELGIVNYLFFISITEAYLLLFFRVVPYKIVRQGIVKRKGMEKPLMRKA